MLAKYTCLDTTPKLDYCVCHFDQDGIEIVSSLLLVFNVFDN